MATSLVGGRIMSNGDVLGEGEIKKRLAKDRAAVDDSYVVKTYASQRDNTTTRKQKTAGFKFCVQKF